MRTNVPWIYAIGDVTNGPMLAHKATHEAKVAAEVIAGDEGAAFDARTIPSVAYTDPEVAWMGLTEAAAKASGRRVREGRLPVVGVRPRDVAGPRGRPDQAAARAGLPSRPRRRDRRRQRRRPDRRDRPRLEMGADAEDLALTIHPHPTLSETVGFAAEVGLGTITDLPPKRR